MRGGKGKRHVQGGSFPRLCKSGVDARPNIVLDYATFVIPIRKLPVKEVDQPCDRRRAGRVSLRVPVEVRGIARDGSALEESAHTAVVSPHGAMVRTVNSLQIGTEVILTNQFSQQTARFRVVWAEEQQADGLWETGIESLLTLDDFWAVRFPTKPDPPV